MIKDVLYLPCICYNDKLCTSAQIIILSVKGYIMNKKISLLLVILLILLLVMFVLVTDESDDFWIVSQNVH